MQGVRSGVCRSPGVHSPPRRRDLTSSGFAQQGGEKVQGVRAHSGVGRSPATDNGSLLRGRCLQPVFPSPPPSRTSHVLCAHRVTTQSLASRAEDMNYDWEGAFGREEIMEGKQVCSLLKILRQQGVGPRILGAWEWIDDNPHWYNRNLYAYTIMFAALAPEKEVPFAEIKSLFEHMKEYSPDRPDVYIYSSIISACEKRGLLAEAKAVLQEMKEQGIRPTEVTYNSYISCARRAKRPEEGLWAFKRLKEDGLQPDMMTYSAMITLYGDQGKFKDAFRIFEELKSRGMTGNAYTFNALITACEKAGNWEAALTVFAYMGAQQIPRQRITFNALVAAAGKGGLRGLVPPTEVVGRAVETVLTALHNLEGMDVAMEAFRSFSSDRSYPNMSSHSYRYLLHECCGAKKDCSRYMLEIFHMMQKAGFTPETQEVYAAAMACVRLDKAAYAQSILELAIESDLLSESHSLDHFCRLLSRTSEADRLQFEEIVTAATGQHPNGSLKDALDNV